MPDETRTHARARRDADVRAAGRRHRRVHPNGRDRPVALMPTGVRVFDGTPLKE